MTVTLTLDIMTALNTRLATLSGLTDVLGYEPTSAEPPMMYTLLDEAIRTGLGAQAMQRIRFLHRLVVGWGDNASAETTLLGYADDIRTALAGDPYLDVPVLSASTRPTVKVDNQVAGFLLIGATLYRVLDTYTETAVKGPFADGN